MSSLYRGKRAEAGRGAQVLGLGIILPAVEAMADALMGARECCTHSPTIQITIQALFMLLILFTHLLVRLGACPGCAERPRPSHAALHSLTLSRRETPLRCYRLRRNATSYQIGNPSCGVDFPADCSRAAAASTASFVMIGEARQRFFWLHLHVRDASRNSTCIKCWHRANPPQSAPPSSTAERTSEHGMLSGQRTKRIVEHLQPRDDEITRRRSSKG